MDDTVSPCDDFYKFTCGKWDDDHPLPAGGVEGWNAFLKLTFETRKYMRLALENLKPNSSDNPESYTKLYNFYHGCLNKAQRNNNSYSMLNEKILDIGGWPSPDPNWNQANYNLESALIESIKLKHFPLIKILAIKDWKSNNQTIISIGPNINPEKDFVDEFQSIFEYKKPGSNNEYYDTNSDWKALYSKLTKELNNETQNHSIDEKLIGNDYKDLNDFYLKLKPLISPSKSVTYYMENYESLKVNVKDLQNFTHINFRRILNELFGSSTIKDDTPVFLQDEQYLKNLNYLLNSTNERVIANYIGSSFVRRFGPFTTTKMVELLVDKLNAPEVLPNICYQLTETYLPNLLGRFYVDKRFNRKGKKEMEDIIDLIQKSFNESLHENDWMDDTTKQEAIMKIENIRKNVAYPKWTANNTTLDEYFRNTDVTLDDFFTSVLNVIQLSQNQNFLMLKMNENIEGESGPSVIDSWPSHDATYINAFYYFSTNGIYFPAGIAQDPFFVFGRPTVMNLGSIGMIIGHEMTHSLDTQGSLYDHKGDFREWWKNSTRQTFLNKSQCFVDQYNKVRFPEQKMNVSGTRTLAENIADNGGLRRAYEALQLHQSTRNETFKRLPGKMNRFTEEQLFFISFANMWCSNMFPSSVKNILLTGSHSPDSVRVTETIKNFDKFAEAFNCTAGSKMNPEHKCVLW